MAKRNESQKTNKKQPKIQRTWVKTPTVYQMEAAECGAASLAMILGYYGCFVPLEQMRIETGVSRDGCNALNILKAARKYGMTCKGYTKLVKDLETVPTPAIIHWNFNHFVVFEGYKGGHPYINDPAVGRRKLTVEDLENCFTGIVLTFEPNDEFKKNKKPSSFSGFVRERLKGQESALAALVISGLLLVVPGMVIPVFSQIFVDHVLMSGSSKWLGTLLLAMAGTVLFQSLFTLYRGKILIRLQAKMALISGHRFLSKLFRLPIAFFDQRYAGDLSQRVQNNNNVSDFLAGELAETVLNIFVACFYLILMFIYSPLLTLIGLTGVAASLLLCHFLSKHFMNHAMKVQQDFAKTVGVCYSGIVASDTLKASGAENEYVSRVLGHVARNTKADQKLGRFQEILVAVPQTITAVMSILILIVGGTLVVGGALTAGMLVAFNQLLSAITTPINKLLTFVNKIHTIKADMNRVDDIWKYEMAPRYLKTEFAPTDEKLSGDVEFVNVSFGYSPLAKPLIEDFHFHVRTGRSVALVGASGCGKSTITKILSGLYEPWGGEVLVDGVPLKDVSPDTVFSSIATVNQSITIFSGSIWDNLTLWNKSVMEQDVIRAAKDACLHDAISKLPGAYDYKLDENGQNQSGGQRQRLEIARALVTNPSILILDEATSALDPIVEKEVMDNIKRRGCTCVIVAHRLSTIRDCDEILVMERGHIVQRGTHEDLIKEDNLYHLLIQNS